MHKNWLVQGLISNWLSTLIVVGGSLLIAYLSRQGSPLVAPILFGLIVAGLILLCIVAFRHLFGVRPGNVENLARSWLDRAATATKTVELPEFVFTYHVTLNGKLFIVAQFKSHPEYIHFHSDVSFTDDDNKTFATMSGGSAGVIRLMRICLALKEVGHSGINAPLKTISLSKRLLVTSDLNEDRFINTLYTVEAALNLVLAIVAEDKHLVPTPTSQAVP